MSAIERIWKIITGPHICKSNKEKNTWLNDDAQLDESETFKFENDGLFLYLLFIRHVILCKLFTQFQSFFQTQSTRWNGWNVQSMVTREKKINASIQEELVGSVVTPRKKGSIKIIIERSIWFFFFCLCPSFVCHYLYKEKYSRNSCTRMKETDR